MFYFTFHWPDLRGQIFSSSAETMIREAELRSSGIIGTGQRHLHIVEVEAIGSGSGSSIMITITMFSFFSIALVVHALRLLLSRWC